MDDSHTSPSADTRAEEERESHTPAKADRSPTPEEEEAAEESEKRLDESGAMPDVEAHEEEMLRLGREVKGEGRI
jgi:hypothetical protein